MLTHLYQPRLSHVHQSINFVLAPLEVFDAESVDRDIFNATLVADFQDSRKSLEAHVVSFNCFKLVGPRPPTVALQHKANVLGNWPQACQVVITTMREEVANMLESVFDWWQGQQPAAKMCTTSRRHVCRSKVWSTKLFVESYAVGNCR